MKNFYGSIINKPVAKCWSSCHRGYLTVNNLKKHRCLAKKCKALQKLDHEYWEQREQKKLDKKRRKEVERKESQGGNDI